MDNSEVQATLGTILKMKTYKTKNTAQKNKRKMRNTEPSKKPGLNQCDCEI
jgi:hypothetical protein